MPGSGHQITYVELERYVYAQNHTLIHSTYTCELNAFMILKL